MSDYRPVYQPTSEEEARARAFARILAEERHTQTMTTVSKGFNTVMTALWMYFLVIFGIPALFFIVLLPVVSFHEGYTISGFVVLLVYTLIGYRLATSKSRRARKHQEVVQR